MPTLGFDPNTGFIARESTRPIRRAIRCPAAGLGWLHLQHLDYESLSAGHPSPFPDDPRQSGQSEAFTEYWWKRIPAIAEQPIYRKQIEERIAELTRERDRALDSLTGIRAQADQLQELIDKTAALFRHD